MESWHSLLAVIAGIAVALAITVSAYGIRQHILHYCQPEKQRRVVRILFMVPLYAAESFLSLCILDAAPYLDMMRDCYEAYVLYQFFLLCVSYLDGEANVRHILSRKADKNMFWPCCCLHPIKTSSPTYYVSLKKGILHFVIVKPFLALIAVIAQAQGWYCDSQWKADCFYMYDTIAVNISQTVALTALALFYAAVKEELRPWNPVWKFLCIKAVLFFSYWQGFMFAVMVGMGLLPSVQHYSSAEMAMAIQDFLICMEMLLFAVAHLYVFGPEEYEQAGCFPKSTRFAWHDILSCTDVVFDTRETFDIMPPAYTRLEETPERPETDMLRSMREELPGADLYQLGETTRLSGMQPRTVEPLDVATSATDTVHPRGRYNAL